MAPGRNLLAGRSLPEPAAGPMMSLLPAAMGLLALVGAIALARALVACQTARRALASECERLLRIVEGTDVGTWDWSADTGISLINERCAQIVGYTRDELGDTTMATWHRFVHPDDATRSTNLLKQHLAGELARYECEVRVRHKDGHWVWILTRCKVFGRDADGRPTRISGTHMDISERKQVETKLCDTELRSLSILNSMTAEIAVLDRNGVIIAVNEAWRRFASENGFERGQPAPGTGVGSNYLKVCQPAPGFGADEEAAPTHTGILAVLRGELPRFSLEYPCHSPTEQRWFSVNVTPLGPDGQGVVISHTNITDRRLSELALQAQNQMLDKNRQVLDAVSEAILVKGPGSKILWANRAFLDYYGMSPEQLRGLIDAPFVEPDLTEQYLRDDAQVFNSGQALDIPDEAVVRFDGVVQRWHTVKSPIFDQQGRVVATVGVSRDITHRAKAESALLASQAFLDATGRIASVGGWTVELATHSVQWTAQTYRIHELDPSHCPTLEDGICYYAPEARPVIEQAIHNSIANGTGFDLELPFITAKGRAIWVRAVAEPELVDGKAVCLRGAFQDITDRRALEEKLQRKTALLASVLEHLPCGLSAYDDNLKFLASNAEHQRLLGLPDGFCDQPGAGLEDVLRYNSARGEYDSEGGEAAVQTYLDVARGQKQAYRLERTRSNGMTLEIAGVPMPNGGFVLTHIDISAHKRAEQALQRQTERLRLAADSAGIGVWEYDPIRGQLEWDDIMYAMYGIGRGDNVAPLELWSKHLHPQDAQRVLAELNAAMEGQGSFKPEFRICRPDGEVRHIQAAAHVVRDAAERPVRVTGVNIDVTLQRLAQDDLREAKHAAESANLAKSQFLANMSHEIRTPMNAILGMLTLLQQTPMTARQADYADKTEGAARSLLRLLNDILDFSKVEAGKMTLDPQPFVVGELLHEVSTFMLASLGTKPLMLRYDIAPEIPARLVGDAMRLQQVLLNLLSNAIKFSAAGEIVLSMQLARRSESEVTLLIAVCDTGIGIAPENHERVFTGFSQAEASTTRRFGGTGLGLAISRQLVALMGGELQLESALGLGSRFHFELSLPEASDAVSTTAGPAPARTATARRLHQAGGQRRLSGLRLLVVEDNLDNQQIARELLEAEGAVVSLAGDGQQAVAAVAQAQPPFDLVLMDLQMPVMDGCTATRLIRQARGLQLLPIVAMTANVMAEDREACLAAGMNGHVGKPFELDDLVGVLRSHVGWPHAEPAVLAHRPSAWPRAVMEAAAAAGVDIEPALHRLGERADLYERMLRAFVKDLAPMQARLLGHVEQVNLRAGAQMLHTLKGVAATLGVVALAGAAALGERRMLALCEPTAVQLGSNDVAGDACRAIEAVSPGLVALLLAMQSVLAPETPDAPAPAEYEAVGFACDLQALCVQLGNGDMAATDSMDALQRRVGGAWSQRLQPAADAVDMLDFERALQLCQQLLDTTGT